MEYLDPGYERRVRGPHRLIQFVMSVSAVTVLVIVMLALYVTVMWDYSWDVPLPIFEATRDAALVARGEYLAYGPARCVVCHAATEEDAVRGLSARSRVPL